MSLRADTLSLVVTALVLLALLCVSPVLIAVFVARKTRPRYLRDWPRRKVRVRDGGRAAGGPFRAIESVREVEVSEGPPAVIHVLSLLGHVVAPFAFFVSLGVINTLEHEVLRRSSADSSDPLVSSWAWLLIVALAFYAGLQQWKSATAVLATDFAAARRVATRAMVTRALLDAPVIAFAIAYTSLTDAHLFAAPSAALLAHASTLFVAVLWYRTDYEAAAREQREREELVQRASPPG